ncbi:DUF2922 domain-containing protein [Lactobacillus sp. ESL0791]|uniref:DUF2922 domain-containing protein n=1 Tax=Lactobacillus sp. ESL0791 TaxID=2983234 RepID=UPI0023F90648|nr:DUF2922 domain-containing protein [Lactobacillus sp. ESL0791]MDF7639188.1 DUF2922 domain-containing protein [Lactobacillus sp. ESL0791]
MTTTTTLKLTFLNSKNKKTSLSFPDAADNLGADAVRSAMNVISGENVFEKEETELYKVPKAADYIKRTVTSVFDDPQAAAGGAE